MAKKFVIAIDSGNQVIRNQITTYLKTKNWGFWHWFDDIWLLSAVEEFQTPKSIYELLVAHASIGNQTIIVFDVDSDSRSYWGRAKQDAWEWLSTQWNATAK
jgi:hypothetical protein